MSAICPITKKTGGQLCSLVVLLSFWLLTGQHLTAQILNKSSEQTTFKSNLMNVEAVANETFRYNITLHNGASQAKIYELNAQVPQGWSVTFRTGGTQVTSVNVEARSSQEITVELNARPDSKPSKYNIPVTAISFSDSLKLNLEAVLKGAFGLELTTPSGRLSDDVTEGSTKEIHLIVKNTATLPLENVELASQAPQNWEVTFEPSKINRLDPAQTSEVKATVRIPAKTIAGDYLTTFTTKNTNATASASFRMTVKTSVLSGWIGILVILLAIALVYNLIRRYGRR